MENIVLTFGANEVELKKEEYEILSAIERKDIKEIIQKGISIFKILEVSQKVKYKEGKEIKIGSIDLPFGVYILTSIIFILLRLKSITSTNILSSIVFISLFLISQIIFRPKNTKVFLSIPFTYHFLSLPKRKRIEFLISRFLIAIPFISLLNGNNLLIFLMFLLFYFKPSPSSPVIKIIEEIYGKRGIFENVEYYKSKFIYELFKSDKVDKISILIFSLSLIWTVISLLFLWFSTNKVFENISEKSENVSGVIVLGIIFFATVFITFETIKLIIKIINPFLITIEKVPPKNILDMLQRIPIFYEMNLEKIISSSKVLSLKNGSVIIREGDRDIKGLYVVLSGKIKVLRDGIELAVLKEGDVFGERGVLFETPRNATCISEGRSKVLEIPKDTFLEELERIRLSKGMIEKVIRLSSILRKNYIFDVMSPSTITKIILKSEELAFENGDVILKEGEEGKDIYILKDGKCKVLKGINKVAELNPGDIFGEIGALHGFRTTTVISTQKSQILKIKEEDFWDIISEDIFFGAVIEKLSEKRDSKTKKEK